MFREGTDDDHEVGDHEIGFVCPRGGEIYRREPISSPYLGRVGP